VGRDSLWGCLSSEYGIAAKLAVAMMISLDDPDRSAVSEALPKGVRCKTSEDCLRLWWRNRDLRKAYGTAIGLGIG
jgi:hypothetical protein